MGLRVPAPNRREIVTISNKKKLRLFLLMRETNINKMISVHKKANQKVATIEPRRDAEDNAKLPVPCKSKSFNIESEAD